MAEVHAKSARRDPKSGVVIPHSANALQRAAAFLIWLLVSLVSVTIRYRVNDPHGFLQRKDFGQAIYCTWHNRLALAVFSILHAMNQWEEEQEKEKPHVGFSLN